jgi:hypothetical protein
VPPEERPVPSRDAATLQTYQLPLRAAVARCLQADLGRAGSEMPQDVGQLVMANVKGFFGYAARNRSLGLKRSSA